MSFSLALLLVVALTSGCAAPATAPADWPMFRGGPARLGFDGGSSLPDKPPAVAWVYNEDKPITFWSSPLVAGGRLYVGGGVLSPFGTRGYIYYLDPFQVEPAARKPKLLWKYKVEKLVFSSPALAGGLLLCGEGTHTDTEARLYALKADSTRPEGELAWEFKVPGTVEASPCVSGGAVYFGTGDDFHCLDLATGRPRWKATIIDVLSSPVVVGGLVFVGSGRSEQAKPENRSLQGRQLFALDAQTGQVKWRQQLPYACSSPITYIDGKLVAGAGTGTFILAGSARSAGVVICHSAADGKQLWSRELPDNVLTAIPVADGLVHVACRNGKYYLLSLADGQVLWEYKCDAALLASPVVSGGRVLLLSVNGTAHCLDFAGRKLLWKLDVPRAAGVGKTAEAFSSPVLAGEHLYLALGSRGLVCLDRPTSLP